MEEQKQPQKMLPFLHLSPFCPLSLLFFPILWCEDKLENALWQLCLFTKY